MPAAGLAAVCIAGAAMTFAGESQAPEQRAVPVAPTSAASPVIPAPGPVAASSRRPSPSPLAAAGVPQRVFIGVLGVDAPVLPILTEGNTLNPPVDPQELGWWADGARPGDTRGSALITGHTVHDGGGALDDLERMAPGAEIQVRTAQGMIRYVAESVDVLDKDTIARRAPQLFSQDVGGRLVLVTCEDWDGTGYRSNVVVTAVPAR